MARCTCQLKWPYSLFFLGLIILTVSTKNQHLKCKRKKISVQKTGCHNRYLQLEVGTTNFLVAQSCHFTPRRIQRKWFLKRMIKYYSNHYASDQMELYMLSYDDVHPSPWHTHRNSASNASDDNNPPLQSRKQGATRLSVFYANARIIINKIAKLQWR